MPIYLVRLEVGHIILLLLLMKNQCYFIAKHQTMLTIGNSLEIAAPCYCIYDSNLIRTIINIQLQSELNLITYFFTISPICYVNMPYEHTIFDLFCIYVHLEPVTTCAIANLFPTESILIFMFFSSFCIFYKNYQAGSLRYHLQTYQLR